MSYESMPGIRRSDLWYINKSPMHFKYHMENPEEPTPALLFGIAAHKMILEPGSFSDEFAIAPQVDRRTKEGKQIWAEFCDECNDNDLTVISKDDFEKICTMDDAIDLNPAARQLLTGDHEQIFTWTDPQTGEECKVKVDCLTEYKGKKYIVDYKTTDSCEDGHFERSCRKYGYKFQAGMYREGVFQNTLEQYGFAFVAQEKTAPYAVRVYICTDEFLNEGYDQFRTLLGVYHDCRQRDWWPGYDPDDPEYPLTELLGEG